MNIFKKLFVPVLISSLVLTGCGKDDEVLEEVQEELTAVVAEPAAAGVISKKRTYTGTVEPNETVNVTPKMSGIVSKVYYDIGDKVKKGDVIFTLDKDDIQDQIRQLESQLKVYDSSIKSAQISLEHVNGGQTQAQLLQYENAVKNASTALENAQIAVTTSKASLDDITVTYENKKSLYDAGVISKNEFDSTELAYTQAKNAYEQAQLSVQNAQTQLTQAQENMDIFKNKITKENEETALSGVNSAYASKESVMTQLDIARKSLNDTSVVSPITGTISQKNINETNMVSAQSVPFVIVDDSVMKVNVNVSENIINSISLGDEVMVNISAYSQEPVKGKISNITPAADTTGTYPVKIEIQNAEGKIKGGMKAELSFISDKSSGNIVVPLDTVLTNQTSSYVYVVENGKAVKKEVTTGVENGTEIEILSGVNVGENIIVKGQNYVNDGVGVKVVTEDGEEKNAESQEIASREE